jgi:hypothetical protein
MGDTGRAETVTSGQSVPQTAAAVRTPADAGTTPGQATRASPRPGAISRPPTRVGGATGDDRAVV